MDIAHLALRAASNPETAKGDLRELALSRDELVRSAVAMNGSTPPDLLNDLLSDESVHVQECSVGRRA